jgi:hypothetical protein
MSRILDPSPRWAFADRQPAPHHRPNAYAEAVARRDAETTARAKGGVPAGARTKDSVAGTSPTTATSLPTECKGDGSYLAAAQARVAAARAAESKGGPPPGALVREGRVDAVNPRFLAATAGEGGASWRDD